MNSIPAQMARRREECHPGLLFCRNVHQIVWKKSSNRGLRGKTRRKSGTFFDLFLVHYERETTFSQKNVKKTLAFSENMGYNITSF